MPLLKVVVRPQGRQTVLHCFLPFVDDVGTKDIAMGALFAESWTIDTLLTCFDQSKVEIVDERHSTL